MEEIEVKFLDIDVPALEEKLAALGAKKTGEYFYKRAVFDYPDWRLDKDNAWLRLRTDGTETTLTYKQRFGVTAQDMSANDEGMKEIEVVVSDYEKTFEILQAVGFIIKRVQENKRTRYTKDTTEFDIDTHPFIPTYLEIESDSWDSLNAAAADLGFDPEKGLRCSTKQVYTHYGLEENDYSEIAFSGLKKKE